MNIRVKINNYGGLLIVFDGPNGVGKTTLINKLYDKLTKNGYDVVKTKEPTESELGKFVREKSEFIGGNALACLISADRYQHIKEEIIPMLKKKKIILCDRYILSSYILQGMDGVEEKFIYNLNNDIIIPDIQFVLIASTNTIQKRLKMRNNLSRFEKNNKTNLELQYLVQGLERLKKNNIIEYTFNTEQDICITIEQMFNIIISYLK